MRFPLSECLQPESDCREKVLLDAHCSLPQVWEVGVRNKLRWRGSAAVEPHLVMLYCPCFLPLFFPLPLYPVSTVPSPKIVVGREEKLTTFIFLHLYSNFLFWHISNTKETFRGQYKKLMSILCIFKFTFSLTLFFTQPCSHFLFICILNFLASNSDSFDIRGMFFGWCLMMVIPLSLY